MVPLVAVLLAAHSGGVTACGWSACPRSEYCWMGSCYGKLADYQKLPKVVGKVSDCLSGEAVCGLCGGRQRTKATCTDAMDCLSGHCLNPIGYHCGGTCFEPVADGMKVDSVDHCMSKTGICGVCGQWVANDFKCTKHTECASGFCDFRTYAGYRKPFGSCDGVCRAKKADGQLVDCTDALGKVSVNVGHGCDYVHGCVSGTGHCGYCGQNQSVGVSCQSDRFCGTKYCQPPYSGTSVLCAGKCEVLKKDGMAVAAHVVADLGGDRYSGCASKDGRCGYCGATNLEHQPCSSDSDCGKGLCCGGYTTRMCTGMCNRKIGNACPNRQLVRFSQSIKAELAEARKQSVEFAQCMKKEVIGRQHASASWPNGTSFAAEFDLAEHTAVLTGRTTLNIPGRRLGGSHTNVKDWEDAPKIVTSGAVLRAVNPIFSASSTSLVKGRRLAGLGKTWVKKCQGPQFQDADGQDGPTSGCKAGAALRAQADLTFKPSFTYKIDWKNQEVNVKLTGTVKSVLRLFAIAGGSCSFNRKISFPSEPPPLTVCAGPVCIVITTVAEAEFGIEGQVIAAATADHEMLSHIDCEGTIRMKDENAQQDFHCTKKQLTSKWHFGAEGQLSAKVYATVGPVTSIAVEGLGATLKLMFTAEATAVGNFKIDTFSEGTDRMNLPAMTKPPGNPCPGAASLVPSALPNDDHATVVENSVISTCGAVAISATGYVEVVVAGLPAGYSPETLTKLLDIICNALGESMVKLVKRIPEQAALTCMAEKSGHGEDLQSARLAAMKFGKSSCLAVTALFKLLGEGYSVLKISFGCFDVWRRTFPEKDSRCSGNVGCSQGVKKNGWQPAAFPDDHYIWVKLQAASCSNVIFIGNVSVEECKSSVQGDPSCAPFALFSPVGGCSCVLAGSMCDMSNSSAQWGTLFQRQYQGPAPINVTPGSISNKYEMPEPTRHTPAQLSVPLAMLSCAAMITGLAFTLTRGKTWSSPIREYSNVEADAEE